jgi:hypothetical protein
MSLGGLGMSVSFAHVIKWGLLALVLGGTGPVHAQLPAPACDCDFSGLPGVIWWGPQGEMTVAELAAYAAPVIWFSPDEPSLGDTHGPGIVTPQPFPFEEAGNPVVYYQLKEVVSDARQDLPFYTEVGTNRADAVINTESGALLLLEYYAYYADEAGFSAHHHDVEGAEFRIGVATSGGDYLTQLGYPPCPEGHAVMFVTRVTGKAHGIEWYWNILDVGPDTRFPMTLLVEEGKHATAPDRNGDGYFTPSFDVNVRINDAWGVRDVIRSGGLFTPSYQAWMTKVRHPEDRVLPPLPGDSPFLADLTPHQAEYTGGNAVYELRHLPSAASAAAWDSEQAGESHLEKFLVGKELPDGPELDDISTMDEAWSWVNAGALKRSLSISAYADGRWGFSWTFPLFIGRNFNLPMTGGYVLHRMYLKGPNLRDFGWTLLYANSASRWMDPYIASGVEWNDFDTGAGVTERRADFVFEVGLKFRTQVGQSPLRFLTFLTEFWGMRVGIKNYGFFDVDRFKYVVEIGAGSF